MSPATQHMQSVPTVFVVDEDVLIRESLQSLMCLEAWQPRYFGSAREFLASPRLMTPGCLIMDFSLLQLEGLDLRELTASRPETPVIFVTECRDVSVAVRAIRAGAVEFFTKPLDPQPMLTGIREAMDRSRCVLARDAELRVLADRFSSLSRREREVLALVVEGHRNKLIAVALGISEITVKAHRGQVMRKMQARSLADLIKVAAKLHLNRLPAALHESWHEALGVWGKESGGHFALAPN